MGEGLRWAGSDKDRRREKRGGKIGPGESGRGPQEGGGGANLVAAATESLSLICQAAFSVS